MLAVLPNLGKVAGGITWSCVPLCEATGRVHGPEFLYSFRRGVPGADLIPDGQVVRTLFAPAHQGVFGSFRSVVSGVNSLDAAARDAGAEVIHAHGLWTDASLAASVVARRRRIPLIISPHGMFEDWAWRHRAWKKRPVWWVWQRRAAQSALALRATSRQEARSIRRRGLRQPVAIVGNGIAIPPADQVHRDIGGQRTALFLSRIHRVKGLLNLVHAWSAVRPAGWRLLICGPAEEAHDAEVRQLIADCGLADSVQVRGAAFGPDKRDLLSTAKLFLLPSFSENFGVVVAEALSFGVPVITTKGTPWSDLERERCGWWVDVGVEPLKVALTEATRKADSELVAMGLRGRAFVERLYSWEKIGTDMTAVYQWAAGYAELPRQIMFSE